MEIKLTYPEEAKGCMSVVQCSQTDRFLIIDDSKKKLLPCARQDGSMPQFFQNQRNVRYY